MIYLVLHSPIVVIPEPFRQIGINVFAGRLSFVMGPRQVASMDTMGELTERGPISLHAPDEIMIPQP